MPHKLFFAHDPVMKSLPPEILHRIFEFLPTISLATVAVVSKLWRAISVEILYTNIEHHAWKPKRVSTCLNTLSCNSDGSLSTLVRHLNLRLWSIDPAFALLLLDALTQTTRVTKLKLSMSETFSRLFETCLMQRGIIAQESIGEGQPELWTKRFLPQLEELELSHGHRGFQLAAGRPVHTVSSLTHIDYHALHHLLPFLQKSRGPLRSIHFHLTGRDANMASKVLSLVARRLPCLTHVFFNFFVSKRANPPRFTPDLLEDLSPLSSLRSVELILPRHARSADAYLYSHFAAVHTLKATAPLLTRVVLDTIRWQHRAGTEESGWSPLPSDDRTHAWWLEQYGNVHAAHAAMVALWKEDEWCIPLEHEIGRSFSPCHQMSIEEL